jgi:LacI family transcriptional regulator
MSNPTLRDIAARLHLSPAAVSMGLHNSPRIAAKTKSRIRAVAQELGYRPNSLMSELASSRWQKAKVAKGSVIAYIDRIPATSPYWPSYIHEPLRAQASLLGYEVQFFSSADFSSSAKLQRVLRNRGIIDVILGPMFDKAFAVQLDWNKFVAIQLLSGVYQLPLHSAIKDHFAAVTLAWQKAVSRGYRRIGVLLLDHPIGPLSDDLMRSAAVHVCQHHLFSHLPALPTFHTPPGDPRTEAFVQWVETNDPDVIIGFSGSHYSLFHSHFNYYPAYITLHTDLPSEISGIPEDADNCAREAVNLLHFCRRTHQWGIPERRIDHVIEPTWHEGTTLPVKPSS